MASQWTHLSDCFFEIFRCPTLLFMNKRRKKRFFIIHVIVTGWKNRVIMFANVPHSKDEKRGNQSDKNFDSSLPLIRNKFLNIHRKGSENFVHRTNAETHNNHRLLHLIASNYSLHSRVCPSALQIPCNLFQLSRYQQIS